MTKSKWNALKSKQHYAIEGWGNGYFDIDNRGNVTVQKNGTTPQSKVVLQDIVDEAKGKHNIQTPMLIRFSDIIKSRVDRVVLAFNKAIKDNLYTGKYNLIYPIKANQHYGVVKTISETKSKFTGLEAGSKPELLAVLSVVTDNKTPIICNGYKDYDYIKIALLARQLGRNITIVVEKMPELYNIVKVSAELNVRPLIGVRCRLALTLAGKWAHSGGEKSKFGLNTTQILKLIEVLEEASMLECLHLIHCHQGSQIANINELGNFYIALHKKGVNIKIIDIGGGLAIDYEGSKSRSFNSTNYSLGEYAEIIIQTVKELCHKHQIAIPDIFSESGRASTAHHAVFVTNITEVEDILINEHIPEVIDEDLQDLSNIIKNFKQTPLNEIYAISYTAIHSIYDRFTQGEISLNVRALAEQMYIIIKQKLFTSLNPSFRAHREIFDNLEEDLAKKVIANFSLFQSMPDAWAIKQLFPIMPLTQLNEPLELSGIIEDITCDSDGKIDLYSTVSGIDKVIKLPKYKSNDPYLLGVFLVGTYQEILGNLHNLFGTVPVVEVKLIDNGKFEILQVYQGFSNETSLSHVGYNKDKMIESYIKQWKTKDTITYLRNILQQHTYLQD